MRPSLYRRRRFSINAASLLGFSKSRKSWTPTRSLAERALSITNLTPPSTPASYRLRETKSDQKYTYGIATLQELRLCFTVQAGPHVINIYKTNVLADFLSIGMSIIQQIHLTPR